MRKTGGRNNHGHITTRQHGGGHKRLYRLVDFKRRKFDVAATVERLEYDPNRTAFIALIKYSDGEQAYILAPQRLAVGDKVVSGERVDIKPGNALPLRNIPVGTIIHNVEMKPGKGGQIARSAGTFVQLVGRDQGYALLRLGSGEVRKVRARMHGHDRRGVEPRPAEPVDRQGRPQPLAGQAPDRARHRDEPDRPSAWRRRRPHQGRPPSGHAVGPADQGLQDAPQQVDGPVHRPPAEREVTGERTWHVRFGKARSSTATC